jgi:hypothetical protein
MIRRTGGYVTAHPAWMEFLRGFLLGVIAGAAVVFFFFVYYGGCGTGIPIG